MSVHLHILPAAWIALVVPALAHAAQVEWRVPEELVADGTTRAQVEVVGAPPGALQLTADQGQIRPLSPPAFEFVPPRLARDSVARLSLSLPDGQVLKKSVRLKAVPFASSVRRWDGPTGVEFPERLLLGRAGARRVRITRWAEPGAPRLHVSAGTVGPLSRAPDGAWEAEYLPPVETFPRTLILAVSDESGRVRDWGAVPLFGLGEILSRTESNALVRVRIGTEVFGPVRTDGKGEARFTIFAPPRKTDAETIAEDALGNVTRRPLDLQVPPSTGALAVCRDNSLQIALLAIDDRDEPRRSAKFAVTAAGMPSVPGHLVAPGVFVATLPTAGLPEGAELVATATLAGAPDPVGQCRFRVAPRTPVRIALKADAARYVAGSGREIHLEATALDADDRPLSAQLRLSADFGELSAPEPSGEGRVVTVLRPHDRFDGRRQLRVRAIAAGDERVTAERAIALEAGKVASVSVTAAADVLVADGESATPVVADARDAFGNPVRAAQLQASAQGEVVGLQWRDDAQRFEGRYVAPQRFEPAADVITISAPAAGEGGRLSLSLQPSFARLSVGVRGGAAAGLTVSVAPSATVDLQFRPSALGRRFAFGVEAGYLGVTTDRAPAGREALVHTSTWLTTSLARVTWSPVAYPVRPYFGASAGVLWFGTEAESDLTGRTGSRGAAAAVGAIAGLERRLGPGALVIEGAFVGARPSDSAFPRGLGLFTLSGGYRLEY